MIPKKVKVRKRKTVNEIKLFCILIRSTYNVVRHYSVILLYSISNIRYFLKKAVEDQFTTWYLLITQFNIYVGIGMLLFFHYYFLLLFISLFRVFVILSINIFSFHQLQFESFISFSNILIIKLKNNKIIKNTLQFMCNRQP